MSSASRTEAASPAIDAVVTGHTPNRDRPEPRWSTVRHVYRSAKWSMTRWNASAGTTYPGSHRRGGPAPRALNAIPRDVRPSCMWLPRHPCSEDQSTAGHEDLTGDVVRLRD